MENVYNENYIKNEIGVLKFIYIPITIINPDLWNREIKKIYNLKYSYTKSQY